MIQKYRGDLTRPQRTEETYLCVKCGLEIPVYMYSNGGRYGECCGVLQWLGPKPKPKPEPSWFGAVLRWLGIKR